MAAYRVVRISPPDVPDLIPIDYIKFIEWLLDYDRLVNPFDRGPFELTYSALRVDRPIRAHEDGRGTGTCSSRSR